MIYLGDFAAFYLIPMILYVVIYTKIALTLSSNEMGDRLKLKSSLICTACQRSSSRSPSPPLATQLLVQSASENENENNNNNNNNNKNTMRLQIPINPVIHVTPKEFFVNGNRRSSQRNRNQVVKMLAVVVLTFAVCWLPYRAMVMYNSFAPPESMFSPDWYIFLSKTMIYINCAINPILYNLMSARFRNAFKRLLKGEKTSIYSKASTAAMSTKVRASTTETRILVENIVHDDDELSIPVIDQAELEEHDRVT